MGIEFLAFNFFLAMVKGGITLVIIFSAFMVVQKVIFDGIQWKQTRLFIAIGFIAMITAALISSFRIVVDTDVNPQLEYYQESRSPVQIITPEPRTETLEGFSPLKQQ